MPQCMHDRAEFLTAYKHGFRKFIFPLGYKGEIPDLDDLAEQPLPGVQIDPIRLLRTERHPRSDRHRSDGQEPPTGHSNSFSTSLLLHRGPTVSTRPIEINPNRPLAPRLGFSYLAAPWSSDEAGSL